MAADTPRLTLIKTQIDSLLASGKTAKISPGDHRTVATSVINYIDNKVVAVGSQMIGGWGDRDSIRYISFPSPLNTGGNYFIVGSFSTPVGSTNMCRTHAVYKDKSDTGFTLLGMSPAPVGGISVLFEYILFAYEEQQLPFGTF